MNMYFALNMTEGVTLKELSEHVMEWGHVNAVAYQEGDAFNFKSKQTEVSNEAEGCIREFSPFRGNWFCLELSDKAKPERIFKGIAKKKPVLTASYQTGEIVAVGGKWIKKPILLNDWDEIQKTGTEFSEFGGFSCDPKEYEHNSPEPYKKQTGATATKVKLGWKMRLKMWWRSLHRTFQGRREKKSVEAWKKSFREVWHPPVSSGALHRKAHK